MKAKIVPDFGPILAYHFIRRCTWLDLCGAQD
jgi:hypothetical protein